MRLKRGSPSGTLACSIGVRLLISLAALLPHGAHGESVGGGLKVYISVDMEGVAGSRHW